MNKYFMRILAAMTFMTVSAMGQPVKTAKEQPSILSFNAGISVPIICYAKTDLSKNNFAGFAKMGFTLEVNYRYLFTKSIGIAGKAFYASNKTDLRVLQSSGHDRYTYFGFMSGPLISAGLSSRVRTDFQITGGIARAISPRILYRNEVLMNKDASTTFVWSCGAGLSYDLSGSTFLTFRTDQTQLKPKFNKHVPDESLKDEQHIVVMTVDSGFGIKF
jgi:hypothetical protein